MNTRRRLLFLIIFVIVVVIAAAFFVRQRGGAGTPGRASAARLLLESEARQAWQASVLLERDRGEGGDDLAALVEAGYLDAALAAKFRRGVGDLRFVSREPMPAVAAGDAWGGPGERTETALPAAHLAVHHDGRSEWIAVDRFAMEIAPRLDDAHVPED